MRVIAGTAKGRTLASVPGDSTRPITDRVKSALFSILVSQGLVAGRRYLDLFGGTGAVGIEALSRGARRAIFIERSRAALNVLRENLAALDLLQPATIVAGKAATVLPQYPADIVFLDPPYEQEREYEASMEALERMSPPLAIVQHSSKFELPAERGRLRRSRVLKQGDNSLSFYEPAG